jgi:hypothetical protein
MRLMSLFLLTGQKKWARSCLVEVCVVMLLTDVADSLKDSNEDADHHYLLFSATFKAELRKVAKQYLSNDHIRIRIGRSGSTHVNVKQVVGRAVGDMSQYSLI